MIVNFLKDTLNKMEENGVSPDDVLYVFNNFGYCSWEEFEKLANFDYNNGYGLVAIDLNLIVRGSDWWLERGEYDGSEWWEFRREPEKNEQAHDAELDVFIKVIERRAKMYNESLLEETLKVLKDSGVRPEDVQYVLTSEVWMTWEEFANIAKKVHYDSGYGIQEIEPSLKVIGNGWWLERAEYDGAEWWKFCTTPVRSAQRHDPNVSLVCKWFEDEVEDEE